MRGILHAFALAILVSAVAGATFGTVDPSFDIRRTGGGPTGSVTTVVVEKGGSLVIGGAFRRSNSNFPREGIARVSHTGELLPGFESGEGGNVLQIEETSSGYLVLRDYVYPATAPCLLRYTKEGAIDPSFQIVNVSDLPRQSMQTVNLSVDRNENILLAGGFRSFRGQGCSGLVRLDRNGGLKNLLTNLHGYFHLTVPTASGKIYAALEGWVSLLDEDISTVTPLIRFYSGDWFTGINTASVRTIVVGESESVFIGGNLNMRDDVSPRTPAGGFGQLYPDGRFLYRDSYLGLVSIRTIDGSVWVGMHGSRLSKFSASGSVLTSLPVNGYWWTDRSGYDLGIDGQGDLLVVGNLTFPPDTRVHRIARLFGEGSSVPLKLSVSSNAGSFVIRGATNVVAYVDESPDLINWSTISTNLLVDGSSHFAPLSSMSGAQYYRANFRR